MLLSLILILSASIASAAGGEHHAGAVPTQTIIYQAINVIILVGGLFYFLKKPVVQYFASRKTDYESAAQKAQAARQAAEAERQDFQFKLSKIQNTAEETIAKAQAEATDLRKQLIADGEAQAAKIRSDAQVTVRLELEKAKSQLRDNLVAESLQQARESLQSKVGTAEHQKLQSNFINNMQAVK